MTEDSFARGRASVPDQSAALAKPALPPALPWTGIAFGLGGYFLWGISPIYFKAVGAAGVPLLELTAHRILWSCLLCLAILLAFGKRAEWFGVLRTPGLRRGAGWQYGIPADQLAGFRLGHRPQPGDCLQPGLLHQPALCRGARPPGAEGARSAMQWGAFALAGLGVAVLIGNADSAIWLSPDHRGHLGLLRPDP